MSFFLYKFSSLVPVPIERVAVSSFVGAIGAPTGLITNVLLFFTGGNGFVDLFSRVKQHWIKSLERIQE